MNDAHFYPIGSPGMPWGATEKQAWREAQNIKRSYQQEVLAKLSPLEKIFDVEQYDALPYDKDRYPLFAVRSRNWQKHTPKVLVTGGVHGYETSGVQGAIRFLEAAASKYHETFDLLVIPCVSPWGYETINRWNPLAVDPNRAFHASSAAAEAAALMQFVISLNTPFHVHFDLHETTDTDNSEFRPALAARDGVEQDNWEIPDGFYLVGDTENPRPAFQSAIIKSVEKVTHIAPPDTNGKIIGETLEQKGVINYAKSRLGLCGGFSDARFVTTTEVYPDSPKTTPENCIQAQVAAIVGGLDYVRENL